MGWSGLVLLLRKFGQNDPWLAYALIWGLVPPLFFTLARQVLWTYVLPGLPGMAIATAVALERWRRSDSAAGLLKALEHHFVAIAAVVGTATVVASLWFEKPPAGTAAFLAAMAVLAWFAWRTALRRNIVALTAAVGLLTPLAFMSTVWLVGPWLSDRNSAKTIVAKVYENAKDRQRPVLAPIGEANYSAGFYAEGVLPRPLPLRLGSGKRASAGNPRPSRRRCPALEAARLGEPGPGRCCPTPANPFHPPLAGV